MQKQGNDFEGPVICNRFFNFIINTLICRGLKRLTKYQRSVDDDQLQEPRSEVNSKEDLDPSTVQIQFKQTEEQLEDWTPVHNHNLGSSDTAELMEKKIVIPIADRTEQKDKKKKEEPGADTSTPVLTGLGLNINEVSDLFIQNTKERMTRNISLADSETI